MPLDTNGLIRDKVLHGVVSENQFPNWVSNEEDWDEMSIESMKQFVSGRSAKSTCTDELD
ncbi:hypothetical protein M514_01251 [Trichuris suis]|uniref:Uncharacterized protein n=1 Tax=Trichuris suis TaxID=68888 RepID=A0A085NMV1_9BILA|nr:hypothetical protein M513_01251 [Trichuris suis]KFD70797.1 hypothetical protein M514_01251 [Trichuris suis]